MDSKTVNYGIWEKRNVSEYDWPGWPLDHNPFGKDFDLAARERMVKGSRMLLPLLQKYGLGKVVLEAGPFFVPLIVPSDKRTVIYADNDPFVVGYLRGKYPKAHGWKWDFQGEQELLPVLVQRLGISGVDSILASHVLNYLDYSTFLQRMCHLLKEGGTLFLNHSTDYGLPPFFSSKRPKTNQEVVTSLEMIGFSLLETREIPTENLEIQPHPRLLLVARKSV